MALRKTSHWERLQREPGWGREPFLSLTRDNESHSHVDRCPHPRLRHRLCLRREDQEMDSRHISVVDGCGHGFSGENSQLTPGSEAECSLKRMPPSGGVLALCLYPLGSHGQCQGRARLAQSAEGGTPVFLTLSKCAA